MKYIDGQNLRQSLDQKKKFSWQETEKVLEDIVNALQYLYENGLCHCDIKPANIIYDKETKKWILVDFGIAKSLQNPLIAGMTIVSGGAGTLAYMSPEQMDGKDTDIRCDIYALGKVIWECLIGKRPLAGTKFPHENGECVSAEIDMLIGKMVADDPQERYQTPMTLINALHKGAKKFQRWENVQMFNKKIIHHGKIACIVLLSVTALWWISDYMYTAKVREVYESKRKSPTLALHEMQKLWFPLGWGTKYYKSLDLETKALEEKNNMETEYDGIKESIITVTDPGVLDELTDEDMEQKASYARNFLSTWQSIFPDHMYCKSTRENLKIVQNKIDERKENKETDAFFKQLTDKPGDTKEFYLAIIRQCKKHAELLKFNSSKEKLDGYEEKLIKQAADAVSNKTSLLNEESDLQTIWEAYQEIKTFFKDYEYSSEKLECEARRLDDLFWAKSVKDAEEALNSNDFENATKSIRKYSENSFENHIQNNDFQDFEKRIEEDKKVYFWTQTKECIQKYVNDHAYSAALKELDKFNSRFPQTRNFDYNAERKTLANSHFEYLRELCKDYERFYEEMKKFAAIYPEQTELQKQLKKVLCFAAHDQIRKIFSSDESAMSKSQQLTAIKYTECEEYQKKYLNETKRLANAYIAFPSREKEYEFKYYWQRPPSDCIKITPSVFHVILLDVSYSMSDSDYKKYKGDFDADIKITITQGYVKRFDEIETNVQSKSYDCERLSCAFYIDTLDDDPIEVKLEDRDFFERGPTRYFSFPASTFSASGSQTRYNDSTSVFIQWQTM